MPQKTDVLRSLFVLPCVTTDELDRIRQEYTFQEATGFASTFESFGILLNGYERLRRLLDVIPDAGIFPECLPAIVCSLAWDGPNLPPDSKTTWFVHLLWDSRNATSISDALTEKVPFLWHFDWIEPTDLYLFGRHLWKISKNESLLEPENLRLLFLDAVDKERKKFERLRTKFNSLAGLPLPEKRELIPENVRIYVWRRDEGRCTKCGTQERLEFDHIIPRSKGGSDTERNIQLLCERCNREKSDAI